MHFWQWGYLLETHNERILMSLSPWFITGLADSEGSFSWSITRNPKVKLGWTLGPAFNLTMHVRETALLIKVQSFFNGAGTIKFSRGFVYYDVRSIKDLLVIIQHFTLFPLVTHKRHMFSIFVMVFNIYIKKGHLTVVGFMQCVRYINVLNKAIKPETLTDIIKQYGNLPLLVLPPVCVDILYTLNPYWIVGFVSGEGCFTYGAQESRRRAYNNYVLCFEVSQSPIDNRVLLRIARYIGTGRLYPKRNRVSRIRRGAIVNIQHFVLPFFYHYPFPDCRFKSLQYKAWLKAAELILMCPKHTVARQNQLAELLTRLSSL